MRRSDERVLARVSLTLLAVSALAAAGCVRRYVEPTPTEAHAIVKFRFLHHLTFASELDELLRIDGFDVPVPDGVRTEARLRTLRVRPVLVSYRFGTDYFHTEMRSRIETAVEHYSCGTFRNPQTCSRTVTRTVRTRVRITDAECYATMSHVPLAGAIYLVQFDFYGHGECAARCYRQLPGVGDEFTLVPCGPSEPPVEIGAGGEVLAPPVVRWPTSLDAPAAEPAAPVIAPPVRVERVPTAGDETPREDGARGLASPRR